MSGGGVGGVGGLSTITNRNNNNELLRVSSLVWNVVVQYSINTYNSSSSSSSSAIVVLKSLSFVVVDDVEHETTFGSRALALFY